MRVLIIILALLLSSCQSEKEVKNDYKNKLNLFISNNLAFDDKTSTIIIAN